MNPELEELEILIHLPEGITPNIIPLVGYGPRAAAIKKLRRCCSELKTTRTGNNTTLLLTYRGSWTYSRASKHLTMLTSTGKPIIVKLNREINAMVAGDELDRIVAEIELAKKRRAKKVEQGVSDKNTSWSNGSEGSQFIIESGALDEQRREKM
jgi:hypothetical protein